MAWNPPGCRSRRCRLAASSASEPVTPIVGRWQQLHNCQELADALNALGLGALAPGVVGRLLPLTRPSPILPLRMTSAQEPNPSSTPTSSLASGLFGSLDQFGNQVDDDTYVVVDSNTIQIGDGTFDYSIQGGTLQLTPVIRTSNGGRRSGTQSSSQQRDGWWPSRTQARSGRRCPAKVGVSSVPLDLPEVARAVRAFLATGLRE